MHLRGHHDGFTPSVWKVCVWSLGGCGRSCCGSLCTCSLCDSRVWPNHREPRPELQAVVPCIQSHVKLAHRRSTNQGMLRTTLVACLCAPAATTFVRPGRTLAPSRAARSTSVRLGEFMEEAGAVGGGSLVGTAYALEMDIGQEKGSWMPPAWARSGARARPTATIAFCEGGLLEVRETGYFDGPMIKFESEGSWNEKGGRVQFRLPHGGLARNDVTLDAGELCFSAACWGPQLARRGGLTIKQRKMGFLPFLPTLTPASFMVGTFTAKPAAEAGAKAAPAPE